VSLAELRPNPSSAACSELAYQLQVGVDSVLELIASQRCAQADEQHLIDSIRSSLTDLFKAAVQCDSRTGLSTLAPSTVALAELATNEASISTNLIAEALQDATEGAAILCRDGTIQHSNSALLALSSSGIHSINGHTLSDILSFEMEDFSHILARVVAGIPWSGKVVSKYESPRAYWISLSHSVGLSPRAPVVALISDITEQDSDTEQELRQLAMHDKLTGLPNRRYFCEHLESLLKELRDVNVGADIAFIDLDDFKHVNDYTGHANGDLLLRALGERIQQALGPQAFVSRFGGDEFAVVMVDQDGTHSLEPYERLRQTLREPFPLSEAEAQISVSIGVTRFPEHGESFEQLMSGADAAMYAAKSLGKNQVVEFSHALQADIVARQQVRSKLRRALDDGEIELWFQPKVCAKSGQHVGCEALARWRTPSGEYIPPGRFVPIAEQTGLISPLGNKVFQLAAEQARCWCGVGLNTNIAVNVSPHQLRRPRFVDQLKSILSETGAQAEWFELEITENAVMEDVAQAVRVMDELSSLGFRIAIDDFGTGYSSLSYLKNFSIHTLKIDLSFVRDLMRDDHSDAIVRSIISLGSGMKLTLVAEGVETQEQANFLREAGCDVLQGYLIGKPVPQQQYLQWLSAR
jgi:diguanylate cyclase (GGDEF)-like protein